MSPVIMPDPKVTEFIKSLGLDPNKVTRMNIVFYPGEAVRANVTLLPDEEQIELLKEIADQIKVVTE